jgi:tetratricopeptide (TPR) repeat protein
MSEWMDAAIALVRAERQAEGERLMAEALAEAAAGYGEDSAPYAARLFELSTVLMASGDLARAAPPLRRAVALRFPEREAEQARLTYAMNLGELLQSLGHLAEAEAVLRTSLAERELFYGEAHAGYAYGLESLAALLHARGSLEEARSTIDRAVDLFWKEGNPRVAAAIATRAPIVKATGGRAFELASRLPDELFDALVGEVLARELGCEAPLHLQVLDELRAEIRARSGESSSHLPSLVVAIARVARRAQARDAEREAIQWLVRHRGDPDTARELRSGVEEAPPQEPGAPCAGSDEPSAPGEAPEADGAGDASVALGAAVWALAGPHVAADLVEALRVGEGGNVEVQLAREPSSEEGEALDRALRHALATLRARPPQTG